MKASSSATSPLGLLHLPLEIRQMIYGFCHILSRSEIEKNLKNNIDMYPYFCSWSFKPRHCIQALVQVCNTVREEVYHIFTELCRFKILDPLDFANNYLHTVPIWRILNIRHIAFHWLCDERGTIGPPPFPRLSIRSASRNVIKVWAEYTELAASVETINFRLIMKDTNYTTLSSESRFLLMKNIVLLVEEINQLLGTDSRKYFVIAPQKTYDPKNKITDICILATDKLLWDRISSHQFLRPAYSTSNDDSSSDWHHFASDRQWKEIAEIEEAVGKPECNYLSDNARNLQQCEINSTWKVIFRGHTNMVGQWRYAMQELDRIRS